MQHRIEVHLHIHEGASPETAEAAVRAAMRGGNGSVELVSSEKEQPDAEQAEKIREFWSRAYTESAADSEGRARPLLQFLAANPERLIPYTEVSAELGFETARSLPGLLGAFGRRAEHRYEGHWPFERKWVNAQWNLWMSKEAAEVINSVI